MERILLLILPNVLYYILLPILFLYFFCRYCNICFLWKHCFCYAVLSVILFLFTHQYYHISLALEMLLLIAYCCVILKEKLLKSIMITILLFSVYSVCNGIVQLFSFWILSNIDTTKMAILQYADSIYILITIFFMICLLWIILIYFGKSIVAVNGLHLFLLIMPIFFIFVVEELIRNTIYGDTIVLDSKLGIVFPVINYIEILFLQVIAFICIFTSLIVYQNIIKSISANQTIQLLKQQNHFQQIYMQEAQTRYQQTRSFRHDIKNHITVLSELLKQNLSQEAYQYLYHMEEISKNLSFTVQTGNVVIDALLSSKFSVAKQKNITIKCDLIVPKNINEMDWCIVLSNALDNAIIESSMITEQKRYICVTGTQKGNFYVICIKNNCREEIKNIPDMGIGLYNIQSVCEKYGGTMHIKLEQGMYQIDMLFIISQQ